MCRLGQRPHDDDALGARVDDSIDVARVDATDREPRHLGVARGVRHELDTDGGTARLRRRRVDGPDADVVDSGRRRRVDLRRTVRREADDPILADGGARLSHRDVVLTDMDTVGTARRRKVRPVVDDEQRTVLTAARGETLRGGEHLGIGSVLAAQLHDVDTAAQRGVDERERLRVADEVQPSRGEALEPIGHAPSLACAGRYDCCEREP